MCRPPPRSTRTHPLVPSTTLVRSLGSGAGLFELLLDLLGLVLAHAFLDGLRRALDESLRFGQAKAGDRADFLDHVDLLATVAGEDDVEFGLFLSSRGASATASRSSRPSDTSAARTAPLHFTNLGEFRPFQDGTV